jgi:Protein of unknown function (DUF1638)
MRLKLISCDVLYREMCAAVARSPHQVDFEFLPKGLHDRGSAEMLREIQAMVDRVDATTYQGVLLGYGLCGNGLAGLTARTVPVVLPRAHDCITLFLGAKERYMEYFQNHAGVYFKTSGWIERGEGVSDMNQLAHHKFGVTMNRAELVAKYGEENADFLEKELHHYKVTYSQFTFIEMGIEPDDRFERCTLEEAARRGWKYEKVRGDMSLIQGLVNGDWDNERYLVVEPGCRVVARYDDGIIGTERAA